MSSAPMSARRIVRQAEAAQLVGLAESTLEKLRVRGGGPVFTKIGPRAVGYFVDDLLSWADARRMVSTTERA